MSDATGQTASKPAWRWGRITADDVRTLLAIVSIIVSLTAFALTYWHTKKAAVSGIKPILVFVYDATVGWKLRNVGSGPALNVVVAEQSPAGRWFHPVRVPPLSKEPDLVLLWLDHLNDSGLGATYNDFEGREYSTSCNNDLSEVFDHNIIPAWGEPLRAQWELEQGLSPLPEKPGEH